MGSTDLLECGCICRAHIQPLNMRSTPLNVCGWGRMRQHSFGENGRSQFLKMLEVNPWLRTAVQKSDDDNVPRLLFAPRYRTLVTTLGLIPSGRNLAYRLAVLRTERVAHTTESAHCPSTEHFRGVLLRYDRATILCSCLGPSRWLCADCTTSAQVTNAKRLSPPFACRLQPNVATE